MIFKIAVLQKRSLVRQPSKNIEMIISNMERAAANNADILLLPECLFYADFDMEQLRSYREREMMGNTFRKVKAYGDLLSGDISYPFIREGQ